jgi:hypothetical protein
MSLLPGAKRAEFDHELVEGSWYLDPPWATRLLLDNFAFDDPIHDPCCGEGRIPKVCHEYGHHDATGSDLVYRGYGQGGVDFFEDWTPRESLIFNVPSGKNKDPGLASRFVMHALVVARSVAVIVPTPFLCGDWRRSNMFLPYPPDFVMPVVPRASMRPGVVPLKEKGGTTEYLWIIRGGRLRACNDPSVTRVFWPPKVEKGRYQ